MNTIIKVFIVSFLCGNLLYGCGGFHRAEMAEKAKTSLVGMSQEEILLCMGPAEKSQIQGGVEVWSYKSGGDRDEHGTKYYCVTNILFQDGKVKKIKYLGRTGGLLTKDSQCGFAVENCIEED